MNREPIYAALFARIRNNPALKTAARTLKHYDDVPPSEQPAIFQRQLDQVAAPKPSQPTKWECDVEWYLYINAGTQPNVDNCVIMNPILDAIEQAMSPDTSGYNTLGGLVFDCKINGKIEIYEGINGGPQTMAIVPIKIIAF